MAQWYIDGRIPEREVRIRSLHTPCCVLEQDTLFPQNIGNTAEAMAPFRHVSVSVFQLSVPPLS